MDQLLSDLALALRERLAAVADDESRRDAPKHVERLRVASERLETLEQQLPGGTDPQLRHFLQRRSYTKALDYLETLERGL